MIYMLISLFFGLISIHFVKCKIVITFYFYFYSIHILIQNKVNIFEKNKNK